MTDSFTYISAFLSIVVALALTRLLGGVHSRHGLKASSTHTPIRDSMT